MCPRVESLPAPGGPAATLALLWEGNHDFLLRPSHQIGNGVKRENVLLAPHHFTSYDVSPRGVEPRSSPSEGDALSVELRGRV